MNELNKVHQEKPMKAKPSHGGKYGPLADQAKSVRRDRTRAQLFRPLLHSFIGRFPLLRSRFFQRDFCSNYAMLKRHLKERNAPLPIGHCM